VRSSNRSYPERGCGCGPLGRAPLVLAFRSASWSAIERGRGHSYIVAAILGTCCIALEPASALPFQQSKGLKASATVDLAAGKPEVIVHLRNDSNVPLEAWALQIGYNVGGGSRKTREVGTDTATDEGEPGTPGRGPILPGETRDERYRVDGEPLSASVTIRMLLFDNGAVEGSTTWADDMLAQRERHAEALGFWIDALNAASRVSLQQARTVLERALASHAHRMGGALGSYAGQSAYERVTWLAGSPDDVLQSRIAQLKERFERVRDRGIRHKSRR
jgi:hypothetical protein